MRTIWSGFFPVPRRSNLPAEWSTKSGATWVTDICAAWVEPMLRREIASFSSYVCAYNRHPLSMDLPREELIRGLLYGAVDLFKEEPFRVQPTADAWAALIAWICSAWPWLLDVCVDKDRFPVMPIMTVLTMAWSDGLRRRMLVATSKDFPSHHA